MSPNHSALARSGALFAALGDATRLRIVARLCDGGPQSIARLTAGSDVTRQAVTKHLLVLAGAGLARSERKGRESRWTLEPEPLDVARRYLDRIADEWTRRLEALERHLDAMPDLEVHPDERKRPVVAGAAPRPRSRHGAHTARPRGAATRNAGGKPRR